MGILFGSLIIALIGGVIYAISRGVANAAGKVTETPLMKAAINGDVEQIKELLSSGAPIDATNAVKNTALSLAVINSNEEAAKTLIDAGASLDMLLRDGKDIFTLVIEGKNEQILLHLIEKSDTEVHAENDLLIRTAKENFSTAVLKKLLEKDTEGIFMVREGDINSHADMALWWSARHANIPNIDFLLEKGAGLSASPILGAVESGSVPLIQRFIELGDNVEAKYSNTGATCLVIAVQRKNKEAAELLLENNANPNVKFKAPPHYKYEESLLSFVKGIEYNQYGAKFGHKVMAPLLEKYGARKKI
jgi:ankyrin repeat protein